MAYERAKRIAKNPFLIAVVIFGVIVGSLYAYSGVWPPMAVVMSDSMMHPLSSSFGHLGTLVPGDIVIIKKTSHIVTYEEGKKTGYKSFGSYGDVIIYRDPVLHRLIIHRAMMWVKKGEVLHTATGTWRAPWSGYLTKGDNNPVYDQDCGIAYHMPIKPEWIVGKAVAAIPWLGILKIYVTAPQYVKEIPWDVKFLGFLCYAIIIGIGPIAEVVLSYYKKRKLKKEKESLKI